MKSINSNSIKVILTDDHKIIRDGLMALLDDDKSIEVVGEAASGKELISLLESTTADVVLLDISMPEMNGLEVTAYLKNHRPDVKVLILSMLDHESYVNKAFENGAVGYLLKSGGKDELCSAIRLVATGATYISPGISLKLLNEQRPFVQSLDIFRDEQAPLHCDLSKREMEVLLLIADGFTNAEIADKLFNSKRTIETHRQNLLEKTKCKNTASLIKYAVKRGII